RDPLRGRLRDPAARARLSEPRVVPRRGARRRRGDRARDARLPRTRPHGRLGARPSNRDRTLGETDSLWQRAAMAKTFREWDPAQGWLLPPSVKELVPAGHL